MNKVGFIAKTFSLLRGHQPWKLLLILMLTLLLNYHHDIIFIHQVKQIKVELHWRLRHRQGLDDKKADLLIKQNLSETEYYGRSFKVLYSEMELSLPVMVIWRNTVLSRERIRSGCGCISKGRFWWLCCIRGRLLTSTRAALSMMAVVL